MIVTIVLVAVALVIPVTWVIDRRRRRKLVELAEQGRLTTAQTDDLVGPNTTDGQLNQAVAEMRTIGGSSRING